jgi:hypothetical protein
MERLPTRTTSFRLQDATRCRHHRSKRTPRGLRPSLIHHGGGTASGVLSGFICTYGCSRISFGAPLSLFIAPSLTLCPSFTRTQDTYAFGIVAGFAASVWSIFLLVRSVRHGNGVEAWHYTAQFFWLFANAWWMYGELTDWRHPHQPKIQPQHQKEAGYMMLFAWIWLFLYYAVLQHMSLFAPLFTSSPHAMAM